MTIPGGIRAKLVLALVLIVGAAQLAAYLMVVPSLERRLVDAKLDQMQRDAATLATVLATRDATDALGLDSFLNGAASTFDARVTVLGAFGPPLQLTTIGDSAGAAAPSLVDDPIALDSAGTGALVRGRLDRAGNSYAEVAVPLFPSAGVMVLSSSLADQLTTVRLVERSIALATVVAAAIALILGTVAAAVLARRIRRLERAANRIAVGHFDEPVVDVGDDELGQLAEAFDRMRVQLKQLDNARKEFVANASHELRTPLFSLAGFLELLADEDLDEETSQRFLATTREQVDRLSRLAGELLDLSRIDAGRFRIEHEDVSLTEVAQLLGDELQPVAARRSHTLTVDAPDDVWALADEERVLQVARALTVNAIVHTPEGSHIVVRVLRDGTRSALSVEDDGPGIPPDHVERVFDRFYRGDATTTSGSGLGLAIARELAECMAGTVSVTTRPGMTIFTLSLPGELVPEARQPSAATVST
jgi:signal transduction histidine kinase